MNVCQIGIFSFESKNTKREINSVGGIQGYIFELINYLVAQKISIDFVGKIYNYTNIKNVKYHQIIKNPTSTNKFLINIFFKSFFVRLPKNSIIHAHRSDHYIAFSLFKNNPSVITLHGQQAKIINDRKGFFIRSIYKFLEFIALKKVNLIIAVDEVTKSFYIERYPWCKNKIQVIPTGVNPTTFKPLNKERLRIDMGFDKNDKIISYIGRIEPPKKVDDIIRAFNIINKKDKKFKLILVGDGDSMESNKKLVLELGLEEFVSFLGIRKRIELPAIFNVSDISVLYSENEGSPLSVKESLACGIPVVSNDVGDVSEIIRNDYNGYILEENTNEVLAKTILLATKNANGMRDNCLESIAQFTTEKVNQKAVELYKTLLND